MNQRIAYLSGPLVLLTLLAAGCVATDPGAEHDAATDVVPGDEAGAAEAEAEAEAEAAEAESGISTCESLRGPVMIEVSTPSGSRYCIDTTEVTESHYQEFLGSDALAPGSEHEECGFNTTYEPNITSSSAPAGGCPQRTWTPDTTPDWPVACIDWCDAYAYCAWAGKRLCGKVGGGEESVADRTDPSASQWYNACSQGGTTKYPYGDDFDPKACSGAVFRPDAGTPDPDSGVTIWNPSDVGTWAGCHGNESPWSSVYDLSGSVWEWTDGCDYEATPLGGSWYCAFRGGSFRQEDAESYACSPPLTFPRGATHTAVGFRCCKDLD